jgi:hypothetical protein
LIHTANRRNKRATISNRISRFMVEIHQHIQIPGTLMVAFRNHEYEQRLKKMNNKTFADLPPVEGAHPKAAPSRIAPGPSSATLAPPRPTQTAKTAAPSALRPALQAGDRVRHPQWGLGEVQKVIRSLASVSFEGQLRTLDLNVAPLEKLS